MTGVLLSRSSVLGKFEFAMFSTQTQTYYLLKKIPCLSVYFATEAANTFDLELTHAQPINRNKNKMCDCVLYLFKDLCLLVSPHHCCNFMVLSIYIIIVKRGSKKNNFSLFCCMSILVYAQYTPLFVFLSCNGDRVPILD